MSTVPRVAVVGGGIAGTLCSLVLKNRGLNPVIIDQGRNGLGGRLRGGNQFMRATDPRLQTVMAMLQNTNVIKPWQGRFGLLGSSKGGFLPAQIVTSGIGGSGVAGLSPADPAAAAQQSDNTSAATDTGDFCQFVQGSTTRSYVGNPEMSSVCQNIANLASISYTEGVTVTGATMASGGGWTLETNSKNDAFSAPYDGLVLASHNPSLASSVVKTIVDAEVAVGGHDSLEKALGEETTKDNNLPLILNRLSSLSEHLQKVRDEGRLPLYTVSCTYPPGFSDALPFDAVSVPGSPFVQFLAKESSKTGEVNENGDVWTAVTTSQLASQTLSDPSLQSAEDQNKHIERVVSGELAQLSKLYFKDENVPEPVKVRVKRWGAALCGQGLELQEDSITLSSWRLGICGDFIRQSSAYSTPFEAAALSGLESGERMASLFTAE